ncbi:MAG: glycosyltransferase [Solirubrobacterales bacterium]
MRTVWSTVVFPVLDVCRPATVVEVGGGDEALDALLEEAARQLDATLVRVGPGEVGAAGPDLALVHGEPNWYSVTEALKRLGDMAAAGDSLFPVTLVHGVDWPTGRRDSYPNPSAVPVGARQPHAPDGGVERAVDEHDQRNGVLTAVEDFLAGAGEPLELIHVPGLGGTALLVAEKRLSGKGSRALRQLLKGLRQSPQSQAQIAAIDAERVRALARIDELTEELEAARAGLSTQSSAEVELLRHRIAELADSQAELKEALARRAARLATLEAAGGPLKGPATPAGPWAAVDAPSHPLPRDRRGILRSGDGSSISGPAPLNTVVRMVGDPDRLRACLWSLLARADRPLRLALQLDDESSPDARELARSVVAAEPRVSLVEGEASQAADEWSLRVDAPVIFGHCTIPNLIAADGGTPRAAAAVSAGGAGVPSWAGQDCLSLLLGGRTIPLDSAEGLASACMALPPRASAGGAAAVALDAPVADGLPPQAGLPAALDPVSRAAGDERALAAELRERLVEPLGIAYVLPGLPAEGSGGSHSIFQEALALGSIGARPRILVEGSSAERAAGLYPEAADLIRPYRNTEELSTGLAGTDVAVATEAPSARLVADQVRVQEGILGAYYVQDYEPLFSPETGPRSDAALLSYRQAESLLLFAKTHWLGNVIGAAHQIPVAKVAPSLDQSLFHARGRSATTAPLRILAMVRPRTPRRRPVETHSALARLKRAMGDGVECLSFGCGVDQLRELPPAAGVDHLGVLKQAEVAEVLRRCDIFLDLSSYQAFGRTGLEAMACGAVPLLPRIGGVSEYAIDDWNSLLVDTADEDAVAAAVHSLAKEPERLERLRGNGIETAGRFTLTRAAISQYACFTAHRAAIRESG